MPNDAVLDSQQTRAYAAFISYSHADSRWAAWIHRQLENYRIPRKLARSRAIPRRLGKVFRDREELATGQSLGEHLLSALDQSANLIVICSPNAVASKWVSQEIEHFKSLGRGDRIFCLLIEGGAESLPAALLRDTSGNPLEPLAADPRDYADGKRLATLKLIAGIVGVQLDELAQRDKVRQRYLTSLYVTAATAFAIVTGLAYIAYLNQRHEQAQATELVAFVVDKWDELRPWIPVDLLITVSEEPITYLESKGTSSLSDKALATYAMAVRQLGLAYQDQGQKSLAIESFVKSRSVFQAVHSENPEVYQYAFELGQAHYYIGAYHYYNGDYQSAEKPWLSYATLMSSLNRQFPQRADYALEDLYGWQSLLQLKLAAPSLLADFNLNNLIERVTIDAQTAIARHPEDPNILEAYVTGLSFTVDHHLDFCDINSALPLAKLASENAAKAAEMEPSLHRKQTSASASSLFGEVAMSSDLLQLAKENYQTALLIRQELELSDPTNTYYQRINFISQLDLFRLTYLSGAQQDLGSLPNSFDDNFISDEVKKAAAYNDLELPWSQIASEYLLTKGLYDQASSHVQQLNTLLIDRPEDILKRLHFQSIAYWLSLRFDIRPEFKFNNVQLPQLSQDCPSRFINWSWNLANGNIDAANQNARDLIDLGYKHPRMAFYSKLAGVPYPPPNTSPPSLDREEISTPAGIQ